MDRALVLNASFEPLCLVPPQRAVVLVMGDKADVLESSGAWHSAAAAVAVPTVIRLRYFVKVPYRARVRLTRTALLARDAHTCVYCGKRASTIDHIQPRSKGGRHEWENVAAACGPCNNRKADKTPAQLGWKLRFAPTVPHGTRWLVLGVAGDNPAWAPYLGLVGRGAGVASQALSA